ncbi:hypothetical protein CcaCcLH18_05927 [Colletotrichum camelliae]|nr:hypothetical protein CcaCcLH18_05927 [Colletotrichum camelliae]
MATQRNRISSKLTEAAEVGKKRQSFFSFGDDGLTATVGASGRLLRISQQFPDERVGFCVDDKDMPEPYYGVERLKGLLSNAKDTPIGQGIGAHIDSPNYPDITQPVEMINHRWPTFRRISEDEIQLENEAKPADSNQPANKSLPLMIISPDLLIRNLDFVDPDNQFNKPEADNVEDYAFEREGNAVFREHRCPKTWNKFGLRILVRDETDSLELAPQASLRYSPYVIRWKSGRSKGAPEDLRGHTFILAYTFGYAHILHDSKRPSWNDAVISMNRLLEHRQDHTLTNNPTLDFFLNRNLEYILSVCSIPVRSNSRSNRELPIALTCGDVENHRIATAASFYCFQILLLGLNHLISQPCKCAENSAENGIHLPQDAAVCTLKRRIELVCKGHMKWLFGSSVETARKEPFCPNYWTNSQEIRGWKDNEYLPGKSLVDTALQIIKAGDFYKVLKDSSHNLSINSIAQNWIEEMDETTNWEHYMFPRYDSEPTPSFHLTDHALIWEAIKSVETMGISPKPRFAVRDYSSHSVRQHMIKGFTVQNTGSDTETPLMAIVRRIALNEFTLTTNDISLIRAIESGFFDKDESNDKTSRWEDTVMHQFSHKANYIADSDDPRMFALCILQLRKQYNLKSESDALLRGILALLQSSSANGLFPGNLNSQHQLFMYENASFRDDYWSNAFEIPYILWKCCPEPDFGIIPPTPLSDMTSITNAHFMPDRSKQTSRNGSKISAQAGDISGQDMQSQPTGRRLRRSNSTQHLISSNRGNPIDGDMMAPGKELFSFAPVFFVPPVTSSPHEDEGPDPATGKTPEYNRSRKQTANEATKAPQPSSQSICDGILVDVPRPDRPKKDRGNGVPMEVLRTREAIRKVMNRGRSPHTSSKRFWAFFSTHPSQNDAYLETVSARQKRKNGEMKSFFRRHKSYANMFSEETKSRPLNTWKTEFHMTTYHIFSATGDLEAKDLSTFARGVISFDFEGDLSGLYWTCRFFESNPHLNQELEVPLWSRNHPGARSEGLTHIVRSMLRNGDMISNNICLGKDAWHERKVLELILLGRAVERIQAGANNVLEVARSCVRDLHSDGIGILEERNHDVFVRKTKLIQKVLDALQTVKAGLDENLEEIGLWQERQSAPPAAGQGSTDGTYHVQEVKKNLKDLYEDHVQEIRRVQSRITKFEQSTSNMLELALRETGRRREDNIRQFTYVTVVFLPLGFATGLFSMSGTPDPGTLRSMVSTAIVALAVTVFLLLYAKTVRKVYFWGHGWFMRTIGNRIKAVIGYLKVDVVEWVVFTIDVKVWLRGDRKFYRWIGRLMRLFGKEPLFGSGRTDEERTIGMEW